jgi:hypothetical protein
MSGPLTIGNDDYRRVLAAATTALRERFGIERATPQLESERRAAPPPRLLRRRSGLGLRRPAPRARPGARHRH